MPTNVSSRITWVEGSHPWHSVLIFPMKIFHVLFYSSLCYLVIINRGEKPLALCCLVDIALPWTCLLCSFQGSLSGNSQFLSGSTGFFSSVLLFKHFWLCCFLSVCCCAVFKLPELLGFLSLLCCCSGTRSCSIAGEGQVQRNPHTSCGSSSEDAKRWWNWGKIKVSDCFITGYMTQTDTALTLLHSSHPKVLSSILFFLLLLFPSCS